LTKSLFDSAEQETNEILNQINVKCSTAGFASIQESLNSTALLSFCAEPISVENLLDTARNLQAT
jgi:hypothetical protein